VDREVSYVTGINDSIIVRARKEKSKGVPTYEDKRFALLGAHSDQLASEYDYISDISHECQGLYSTINPTLTEVSRRLEKESHIVELQNVRLEQHIRQLQDLLSQVTMPAQPVRSDTTTSQDIINHEGMQVPIKTEQFLDPSAPTFQPAPDTTPPSYPHKIVLLSDSIISKFDAYKWARSYAHHHSGEEIIVEHRRAMRLDLVNFNELSGFHTIIISCGINDFKYGLSSPDITRIIDQGLNVLPPTTRVIFRALTKTAYEYQNTLVADLNIRVFDLSRMRSNLSFYDVFWLEDKPEFLMPANRRGGNGVHLSDPIAIKLGGSLLHHAHLSHVTQTTQNMPLRPALKARPDLTHAHYVH